MSGGEEARIPKGAVQCLKCKSVDVFICVYPQGDKAIFAFSGLSKDDQAIYNITHTTNKWKSGRKPVEASCGRCGTKIPLWMLEMNRYARSAHST